MTSYAIQIGVIRELSPFRRHSSSGKSKNSYFGKIVYLVEKINRDVDTRWDELSEEDREALKSLAYAVLNPANEDNSSQKNSWKYVFLKWLFHLRLIVAIVTGQAEVVLEAKFGLVNLAHAIMEAVEREEGSLTASFLDKIMEDVDNNPSKLVPFTKEMDEKLEQLLNGVELD